MSHVLVASSAADLFMMAGERFLHLCNQAINEDGRFVVALSGGSTPRSLHEYLVTPGNRERLDWTKGIFLWGDERSVPPDHPDSNYRMAQETLLDPLSIDPSRVHRMPADKPDLAAAAANYAKTIAKLFPAVAVPKLDLVLLGMGDDGHTASLFPGTAALNVSDQWVVANHVPQLDTWRMTMTYPLINAAKNILLLVKGSNKAERLNEVLHGELEPDRLPSQAICPVDGRLEWIVDTEAAAKLPCV